MGFELLHKASENWVGETIRGSPLGVSDWGFHCPDVFSGECFEGGDAEIGGGGGGGFGTEGGGVGEDGGDGEEEEWGGGGGGECGGRGGLGVGEKRCGWV